MLKLIDFGPEVGLLTTPEDTLRIERIYVTNYKPEEYQVHFKGEPKDGKPGFWHTIPITFPSLSDANRVLAHCEKVLNRARFNILRPRNELGQYVAYAA